MKTMRGISGFIGGLTALVLLGSASSASAALIHDIFDGSGASAGFIEFNTENHTDLGAMVTGFQLDMTGVSFDLADVDQGSVLWTINPNTWELTGGVLETLQTTCNNGSGTAAVGFLFTSPGVADATFASRTGGCEIASSLDLFDEIEQLTFAPRHDATVDEPSALLLFGVGLVGLILWRRPKGQIRHA